MCPLFFVYFAEYFINQGLVSAFAFIFAARDFLVYFILSTYQQSATKGTFWSQLVVNESQL